MKGTAARFFRLGVSLTVLVTVGWVLVGQAAKPVKHGVSLPTDWSHQHLVFSHPSTPERAARANADVRYWQQIHRREQRLVLATQPDRAVGNLRRRLHLTHQATTQNLKRDWSESLGAGATAGAGNYPAKFSFDTTTAFCDANTTPDFVVYSTGPAGLGTQASIVAYDNLYNGCGGQTPLLYWAYNTGGEILTSPVLSLDGTQVAFVQTTGGAPGVASLVILKWHKGDGTVGSPVTLVPTTAPLWPGCTAPCMFEVPLQDNLLGPLDDTTSSPFYDYDNDIVWVGGTKGWLHKITGVFKGTPAEIHTGQFPVQVNNAVFLSSPVYDRNSHDVFVSDTAGFLYRVSSTGGVTSSGQLDASHLETMAGPVVDAVAGVVYVFSADDGTTNCTDGTNHFGCTGVFQLPTNFSANSTGTEVVVGSSNLSHFPNPLFLGAFDSAYFEAPATSPTGNLYVCGNTGGIPTLYQVPIVSGVMSPSIVVTPLANTGSTAACSGVTDVPNPNQPPLPSERLFVSVANDGTSTPCSSGGCVLSFVDAPWVPDNNYAVGEQVLSLQMHVETVTVGGTSAFYAVNHPTWTTQIGDTVTDGTPPNQITWIDQGSLTAPFSTWAPLTSYITPLIKILDPNGNVQALTTTGTTSASPTWSTIPGTTTPDGSAVWMNVGALGTAALPMPGGTSGMIIDNTLGTFTVPGDSEIYFTTLTDQSACGATVGTSGCAVQASQTGLN